MNAEEGRGLAHRMAHRMTLLGWISNGLGAAVVFTAIGFLVAVFFNTTERDALGLENLPTAIALLAALGLAMTWVMKRRRRQAWGWLSEGREPTDEERRRSLGMPTFVALLTATGWTIAGVVGGALNLDHSLGTAAIICFGVWLGGETTSALAYLTTERTLRPITALALATRDPDPSVAMSVRQRLLYAWSLGTAVPLMSVLVVGIVGLTKPPDELDTVAAACVFLGAVALAVGLLATAIVAKAITDPLNSMRAAVSRLAAGDLDVQVPIDDASEVGLLQAGFNRMAEGLREREHIRDLFGRQVGVEVAQAALQGGTRLGGEEREIGALFVDLTGSTSMALAMPPTQVVRLLNKFFRVVIEVVESEGGFVNKFEGDAALCVFGAPAPSEDPAGEALCAARVLASRLEKQVPEIGFGIGVSAGPAVAGNVGSEHRFEYTVIGDPVNEAARLSDLAKQRDQLVIASNAAIERASSDEAELWDLGDRAILQGRLDATGLASPRA
jgi:adenylate cyclase